jgi:hypothetical protein
MNLDTVFQKRGEVIVRCIAGEILLIPIRNQLADMQKIFSMNSTAEFIWNQLDGKQNLSSIKDRVMLNFAVGEEIAVSDIKEYICQLRDANIIEEV